MSDTGDTIEMMSEAFERAMTELAQLEEQKMRLEAKLEAVNQSIDAVEAKLDGREPPASDSSDTDEEQKSDLEELE